MKKFLSVKNMIFLCLCSFMLFLFVLNVATMNMSPLLAFVFLRYFPFYAIEVIGHFVMEEGEVIEMLVYLFIPYFVILLTVLFMYLGIYKKRYFSIPVYIILGFDLILNIIAIPVGHFVPIIIDIIMIAAFTVAMKKSVSSEKEDTPGFVLRGEWAKL